jgi:hypothetical protein
MFNLKIDVKKGGACWVQAKEFMAMMFYDKNIVFFLGQNFKLWKLKNSLQIEQKVFMEKIYKSCHILRKVF